MDKSVFLHHGTGIPMETRPFFEIDNMKAMERKDVKLIYNSNTYDAYFKFDNRENARTRLFWNADFRDILKKELPIYYDLFDREQDVSNINLPKMRVEKIDQYNFNVEFIIMEDIESDLDSEDEENNSQHSDTRTEGKVTYAYGKKYERDSKNRADAIAYHGTRCKICKFDFEKVYGSRGKGYIEIHHINPLSNIGEEVNIDPKVDLIPVCSNCHRMIHRKMDNVLTIEDMIELVETNKANKS